VCHKLFEREKRNQGKEKGASRITLGETEMVRSGGEEVKREALSIREGP